MIEPVEPTGQTYAESNAYQDIVEHMHELYQGALSAQEAHETTRNLIGFCQVLLEIKSQNP